jgi:hypothetical protein
MYSTMTSETAPNMYEILVAAKEKYMAMDVLLTELVPERLHIHKDFMAEIAGLLVSDLGNAYIRLPDYLSDKKTKLVSTVFYEKYYLPHWKEMMKLQTEYNNAQRAVDTLNELKGK